MTGVALVKARDEARFGGKAVKLGAALRAGLPVPGGYALDAELVAAVGRGDRRALGVVEEIAAALGGAVAVRSSAVGEDSGTSSFAGQHLTVLNVDGPRATTQAVAAVHASAFTEAARAYRLRRGIGDEPRMGVVVQRLVEADRAGVMFTRNPLDGSDEIVIEAAWGLGETVVSGLVTPDLYRLDRAGRVLEETLGVKDVALHAVAGGGTVLETLPDERANALVLDRERLARLHALALRAEAVYGRDLDIEWVFAGDDLRLVQSRAITSRPARAVA